MEKELAALPFWKDLTKEEKELVERYGTIREYESGSIIHSHEQECLGLIKVLSGKVRTFMLSEEGREITLYQMGKSSAPGDADDIDVLSASCVISQITFETQMVADTEVKLLVVPAICMSELKESNIFVCCYIYQKLGERFSDVMKVMQNMLFSDIDHRIAACLLELSADGQKEIRITHEEIAMRINSSREVVSRALKKMEKNGIVKLGRGRINIIDRERISDEED